MSDHAKILLIDDSSYRDPLVEILRQQFVEQVEIQQIATWIENNGYSFDPRQGRLTQHQPPKDQPARALIDRVSRVAPQTLAQIDGHTGLLFEGQVLAIHETILQQPPWIATQVLSASPMARQPLPVQWALIRQATPPVGAIATPEYQHGYGMERVSEHRFARPIHKSPFDLYQWRPNPKPTQEQDLIHDHFIVNRPEGRPIMTWFVNDRVFIQANTVSRDDEIRDVGDPDQLLTLTRHIQTLFGEHMGEILWFMTAQTTTFAAFSAHCWTAQHQPMFRDAVHALIANC